MTVSINGVCLKVDLITDAYSQLRISGLTVDPTNEDLEVALMRLEDMAAEFDSRNISVGYNFELNPDPNSDANVPREFKYAFATNLAIRLIADFNKQVPQMLLSMATQALSNMSARAAAMRVRQTEYPRRQPRGSGSTLRYNRWQRFYRDPLRAPVGSDELNIGEINDYKEDFSDYLIGDESIDSFTITADPGLTIVSSSNDTPVISYRLQGTSRAENRAQSLYQVTITVTTSTGRVSEQVIPFNVSE